MTNRITGKLIPKDNRNVQFYADFFPNGDIGGSGSGGSTSGIPTIDKNTQPNIVWREPTAEYQAKFNTSPLFSIEKVADLPDGKVPLFMVIDEDGQRFAISLSYLEFPTRETDGNVYLGGDEFVLSRDWSLLGVQVQEAL